jgi:hypothetical protein
MKKLLPILIPMFLWAGSSWGQVNTYSFSYSMGTYNAVSSGTQLIAAGTDDGNSAVTNIGFDFTFNGITFTQFIANANGNIRLGTTTPTGQYFPISTTTNTNAISVFGRDGRTGGAVVYELTGTAPDRVLTIDYPSFNATYGNATTYLDAQIKLYETTNVVQFIYGNSARTSSYAAQVGLRGTSATTDYNNRTTATDWSSTSAGATSSSTITLSTTVFPISGTTYTWTPPVAGTPDSPTTPTPANASLAIPINGDVAWTFGANTATYDLWFGPTGNMTQVVTGGTAGATGSYTYSGLASSTVYQWQVIAFNGTLSTPGPVWSFTTACGSESLPYIEDFEGLSSVGAGIVPNCMAEVGDWNSANAPNTYNRYANSGTNYMFTNWSADDHLFTPAFDLVGGVSYNFSFSYSTDGLSGWTAVEALYGTGQTALDMVNTIGSVSGPTNTSYVEFNGGLTPTVSGTYYISIHIVATGNPWYICIDDLSLAEASTSTLSWYNYQWPDFATINVLQNQTAYAKCWEPGVTDLPGPGAGIECWIGYSTTDTDPSTWTNWVNTSYNYGADPSNDDEFMADIGNVTGLQPGTYYLASRWRFQGGPFTYGGYPNGPWNGTTQVSGVLTVNPLANDDCNGAITLICSDAVTGTTTGSSLDNVGTCGVTNSQPGVWYMFTGMGDMVSVDLCTGTTWDSKISVFEGPCGSLTCVDGNDDYCGLFSRVDWFAESGVDYYILVHQYGAAGGAFTITVNCSNPATAIWQGDDSPYTDWFGADNWDVQDVPGSTTDIIIPTGLSSYPTVDRKGICNNITMGSGARLVDMGAGYLIPNGLATIDRYYTGGEWHLISSPVTGATANMFMDLYLQNHMESTNMYYDIEDPATLLNPMKGYALWNDLMGTAQFTGTLNTGYYDYNATRLGEGWNLVGNPYPSPIDWDAATGWTKTNIDNATYRHVNSATWAEYVGGVGANGGSRYIAAEQGFFVGVTNGFASGTLGMTNAVRTHNTATFFKEEVADIVRLEVSGNGFSNETVIRFLDIATPEFDGQWDAHKLFGTVPEAPAIYSSANGMMSINSLPATNTVAVGVKAGIPGEFTISATETSDFTNVLLEDLLTGTITNLKTSSYTFNYNVNLDDRFILHFTPLSVGDNVAGNINIYSFNSDIYVRTPANTSGIVKVYTMMGQEIMAGEIKDVVTKINMPQSGNYVVVVYGNDLLMTEKVFVK